MDWRTKGLPHGALDIALTDIPAKSWNVLREDLPLPLAVLRVSALTRNRQWMREFLARTGAKLAPHGKTHMSPQVFQWQLEDGAWAITLATVHQVRIARGAGIKRVLLANEIVGARDIEYVLDELRALLPCGFRRGCQQISASGAPCSRRPAFTCLGRGWLSRRAHGMPEN